MDNKLGWSPLYRAVICNQYQVAKLLLEHCADPNSVTRLGESPLHQAADSGLEDLTKLLLAHQADPNLCQNGTSHVDGDTPLHRAAEKGRDRIVQLLLNAGADINAKNFSVNPTQLGRTPLHLAVLCNQVSVVKLLLQQGADRDLLDNTKAVALDLQPTPDMTEVFLSISRQFREDSDDSFTMVESPTLRASEVPSFRMPQPLYKALSEPSQLPQLVESDTTGSTLLNRTFSFGTDIRRSKLVTWLACYKLEKLESVLISAGIDSFEDLIRHGDPHQLVSLGIQVPGLQARLMAALEAELGIYPPPASRPKRGPFPALECCRQPIYVPGVVVFGSLHDWLCELEMEKYTSAFEAAGYDHLESLLGLTKTRYPVTEETLKEMGVEGHLERLRLLQRIHEDGARVEFFRPRDNQEETPDGEKSLACQLCKVM